MFADQPIESTMMVHGEVTSLLVRTTGGQLALKGRAGKQKPRKGIWKEGKQRRKEEDVPSLTCAFSSLLSQLSNGPKAIF